MINLTKREQYKLEFGKTNISGWGVRYTCIQASRTPDSIYLSSLLDLLSKRLAEALLEEIEAALNGADFDEYFSFDTSAITDSVRIVPPNAVINNVYTISLINLKALLQEWIDFCNS